MSRKQNGVETQKRRLSLYFLKNSLLQNVGSRSAAGAKQSCYTRKIEKSKRTNRFTFYFIFFIVGCLYCRVMEDRESRVRFFDVLPEHQLIHLQKQINDLEINTIKITHLQIYVFIIVIAVVLLYMFVIFQFLNK